jgi:hypothetical protein
MNVYVVVVVDLGACSLFGCVGAHFSAMLVVTHAGSLGYGGSSFGLAGDFGVGILTSSGEDLRVGCFGAIRTSAEDDAQCAESEWGSHGRNLQIIESGRSVNGWK